VIKIIHKYYSFAMYLNMADAAGCPVYKLLCCAQEDYQILSANEHFSPPQKADTRSQ
jgi:hypothetical protein